jgi:hypothetical protein
MNSAVGANYPVSQGGSMPRGGEFDLGERPLQRHPLLH